MRPKKLSWIASVVKRPRAVMTGGVYSLTPTMMGGVVSLGAAPLSSADWPKAAERSRARTIYRQRRRRAYWPCQAGLPTAWLSITGAMRSHQSINQSLRCRYRRWAWSSVNRSRRVKRQTKQVSRRPGAHGGRQLSDTSSIISHEYGTERQKNNLMFQSRGQNNLTKAASYSQSRTQAVFPR